MPAISNISIVIKAITRPFVKGLKKATGSVKRFTSVLSRDLMGSLFSLKGLFVSLFAGALFTKFIGNAVEAASSLEALNAQFKVLLGSQDAANQRMKELVEFSAQTPFQLEDLAQASKSLEVMTNGALSTAKGMTLIGDVVAATGKLFDEIVRPMGRLQAMLVNGEKAVGEESRRLFELGIISRQTLVQIRALAGTVEGGTKAWKLAVKDAKRFEGTMAVMSKTAKGLWSTLKDNLNIAMGKLGKILLPLVKAVLTDLIVLVKQISVGFDKFGSKISSTAKIGIAFVKMLSTMTLALGNLFPAAELNQNFNAFENGIIGIFGTLSFFFGKFAKAKGTIQGDIEDIGNIIVIGFSTAFTQVGKNIAAIVKLSILGLTFMGRSLSAVLEEIQTAVTPAKMIKRLNAGGDIFGDTIKKKLAKIRADLKPESRKLQKSMLTLSDAFEKNLEKFGVKTKGKFGGGLSEMLSFKKEDLNKFLEQFRADVEARFKEMQIGDDMTIKVADEGNIVDGLKKAAGDLFPKLAVKGSQEAARIGRSAGLQEKMAKVQDKQLVEQKEIKMTLQQMLQNQAMAVGDALVNPFAPGGA